MFFALNLFCFVLYFVPLLVQFDFTFAPYGHPNISPVDWIEGPEGKVPVARIPCDEGTAYYSSLPLPRKLVRPRRRTGFAPEVICLYFKLVCLCFCGKPQGSTQDEPGTKWICGTKGSLRIGGTHAFEVGRYII